MRQQGTRLARHRGQGGQAVGPLLRPAIFDRDIATFDIAHIAEALAEAAQPARVLVGGGAAEEADHRYPLLRARRKQRRRRAGKSREDLAPPHSITSSARARSVGGIVRLSALAVFRFITSSCLVGACTGKSAGYSPLRIRSM